MEQEEAKGGHRAQREEDSAHGKYIHKISIRIDFVIDHRPDGLEAAAERTETGLGTGGVAPGQVQVTGLVGNSRKADASVAMRKATFA